jgi:hypothetical protein
MTVTVFIFLIVLSFCLYQIAAIILNLREIRRLRDVRYRMMTQHSFGVARQKLMMLVGNKELSSKSITFLNFYLMDTYIMRNPDKYREIADRIRESFIGDIHDSSTNQIREIINKEKADWTPGVRDMVSMNAEALTDLMISHSPFLRILYTIAIASHRLLRRILTHEFGLFTSGVRLLATHSPAIRTFKEAKDELRDLASAT